jgi:hypothetical protein
MSNILDYLKKNVSRGHAVACHVSVYTVEMR